MMVFFSLILALALLAGIIYILRHHQERTRQSVLAREQPLPPLASDSTPFTRPRVASTTPPTPARPTPTPTPKIAEDENAAETPPNVTVMPAVKTDWRQTCQTLRDQGHYDAALNTCRQAWPQWQSYDHAARVIRAAIRNTSVGPTDDPQEHQQWLHMLYTLAAQASFLHDKIDGLPEPTRQLLAQQFNEAQIDRLEMPWREIGYRELRLLTKSDRKQFVQEWGEPETHQSARNFHRKQWLTAIS